MPRKQNKYHAIYKTTCKVNGKYYYGMHSTNNLDDGYLGSGKRLKYSINKYGRDNFEIEYLEFFDNRTKLVEREKELINEQLLKEPLCMNLKLGGEGGWTIEQQRLNAIYSHTRQKVLKETDPIWVEKKYKNQSICQKLTYANGRIAKIPNWTGKQHTQESKQKMKNSKQGHGIGETNSQFGTCWITKENENKKIKNEFLDTFIQDGWIKGRKTKNKRSR